MTPSFADGQILALVLEMAKLHGRSSSRGLEEKSLVFSWLGGSK